MSAAVRFALYGLLGWAMEVVFTAIYEAAAGTRRPDVDEPSLRVPISARRRAALIGRTSLWMFPLYGALGLAFEAVHGALGGWPWPARGAIYAASLMALEGAAGLLLRRLIGSCPWDYSYARLQLGGVVRLDYAPLWAAVGLGLERVHALLTVPGALP